MAQLQQDSPGRYVMKDLYLFSCKREILARKLETLPITISLKPIRPETALRRALSLDLDQKRYTFEESSFEKVNDKPVQIILSREALGNGDADTGVGKAYVERGRIEVNTMYPEIRACLDSGFRFHMETAITRDLSIVVTKYLTACMGIPVRPKNGEIYFALEKYIPEVLELMTVIDSLGQESTIRVSPVVGDEVQKVVERAHDHFRTSVKTLMRLTEEISDETHTKTLNTRLKDARDLLEQAAAYEIGLGMELEEVKGKIQEAKSRIAERLLGKTVLTNHSEESASTTAYLAGPSGQLDLIR
jgi:hypothetical protein